jgi:periplasmic divalent cation tolerance protein
MAATPTVLTVLTTTDSLERAETLAAGAVRRGLAACAQVGAPVVSFYRWQGELTRDQEWQVLLKTTTARYAELESHLKQTHDYEEPEIIATEVVRGSPGYLAWVAAETAPDVAL